MTKVPPRSDPRAFDDEAINRILVAIDKKYIPANLDRDKLSDGLEQCLATYHAAVERNSDRPTKNRIRRLKSIRTAAARFKTQLAPDAIWDLDQETEYIRDQVGYLIDRLDGKINDLNFDLRVGLDWEEAVHLKVPARTYTDRWRGRSPLEWLAGAYLPKIVYGTFRY